MSEPRKPARERYDAIVDLATNPEEGPYAMALVKFTYRITPHGLRLDTPEPLLYDLRDEQQAPRLIPGTDFWPAKRATDVVVQGAAFAPCNAPVPQMHVSVTVGGTTKRVAVFGRRLVQWTERGTLRFTPPEPFLEVPLIWQNAYGGLDGRVTDPEVYTWPPEEAAATLAADHPGLYPRNPFGKGYLVEPDPVPDIELPQLEDPNDLLTPERLIVRNPRHWYRQPLPWCYEWVHPMMFPRYVFSVLGPDAWYPGPEDEQMPEVRRGFLMRAYRTAMEAREVMQGPAPMFFQGASQGLVFSTLSENTPVRITGMHPEEATVGFSIPPPPIIYLQVEARRERVLPRLHSVVCRPAQKQFYVLYGATMVLQRPLIPGIHKHIPIAVSVNGDQPVAYEAPVPVREQLAEAMAQRKEADPLA